MKMLSACLNLLFPRSVSLILIWASFTDIQSSLLVLTKMMQEYYKKPVILLMDEYFGFTGNDVKRLLQSADLEKYGERIQSWYDGYHFGEIRKAALGMVYEKLLEWPAGCAQTLEAAEMWKFFELCGSLVMYEPRPRGEILTMVQTIVGGEAA